MTCTTSARAKPHLVRNMASVATLLCILLAGCGNPQLETQYGVRRSDNGTATSVNGTSVLSDMFVQAGHSVRSRYMLTPQLFDSADCIVWFPNDFELPDLHRIEWFETWLSDRPNRTLIYVGRDFDAAPGYWRSVLAGATKAQQTSIRQSMTKEKLRVKTERQQLVAGECEWFSVQTDQPRRDVRTFSDGVPHWLEDVDPAQCEIALDGRLIPSPFGEVLLESKGDPLVFEEYFDGNRLIVVANGSFLLNAALVNHEHRKLAAKLVDEIGPASQATVFLESSGNPPIRDSEPEFTPPTGLEMLVRSPTCWVFLHLAIAGVVFCFSRWPIFGIPRRSNDDTRSDFGKHIEALGQLLGRSQDKAFAHDRINYYRTTAKGGDVSRGATLPKPSESDSTSEKEA